MYGVAGESGGYGSTCAEGWVKAVGRPGVREVGPKHEANCQESGDRK